MFNIVHVLLFITDFLENNEPRPGVNTAPTFNLKKVANVERTVLVLDVSGSMDSENRIVRLGQVRRKVYYHWNTRGGSGGMEVKTS